jgi:hypothetical protein
MATKAISPNPTLFYAVDTPLVLARGAWLVSAAGKTCDGISEHFVISEMQALASIRRQSLRTVGNDFGVFPLGPLRTHPFLFRIRIRNLVLPMSNLKLEV